MTNNVQELIIIAGANGSGKTTFAKPYVEALGYLFLNADEIAKKLQENGHSNVLIKAGRIFFQRLNNYLAKQQSFVVETTLSGTYINKVAKKAITKGYRVHVIYIFLDDPNLCIDRVKIRVKKGGHNVPIEAIVRRYYRSKDNFWNNFTKISNSWVLLYNGTKGFQQVAIGTKEAYSVENEILFNQFKSIKQ